MGSTDGSDMLSSAGGGCGTGGLVDGCCCMVQVEAAELCHRS